MKEPTVWEIADKLAESSKYYSAERFSLEIAEALIRYGKRQVEEQARRKGCECHK